MKIEIGDEERKRDEKKKKNTASFSEKHYCVINKLYSNISTPNSKCIP